MKYGYLYDKYTLKNGNTSVAKDEILTYTNSLAFEVTGKKAGTTTITIVGDNKRTYQLKVTVVKKNNEMQPRSKKVVSILENKYHLVPEITSDVKQYILNPEAATWEQANITLTTDNEYVGIMLPPSGTGSESWLSIVKEVIQIMAPKNGAVLYSNLISDPYVSSTKILEGMNVTALSYGDRYLWFESGSLIN